MSRQSGSSKSNRHRTSAMNSASEGLIEQSKSIVDLLNVVVTNRRQEWEIYVVSARSAMNALDHVHFFHETNRLVEQVWLIHGIQDFAFHDPDTGYIQDMALWCEQSWLRLLRSFPDNGQILAGKNSNVLLG